MCSLTVGGGSAAYSEIGAYGPIAPILHPIHHGILGFVGFRVIEPFVVFAPSRMTDAERQAVLDRYRYRMLHLEETAMLPVLDVSEFDGLVRRGALGDLTRGQ